MPRQLLRLQAGPALRLLPGLLRRYAAKAPGTLNVELGTKEVPDVLREPKTSNVFRHQHSGVREVQEEPVLREQRQD